MINYPAIESEIVQILVEIKELEHAVLFGSRARGTAKEDSDIDLLVILRKPGISHSFAEQQANKKIISSRLIGIRKRVPLDILVYTGDEWQHMQDRNNDFSQTIRREGKILI